MVAVGFVLAIVALVIRRTIIGRIAQSTERQAADQPGCYGPAIVRIAQASAIVAPIVRPIGAGDTAVIGSPPAISTKARTVDCSRTIHATPAGPSGDCPTAKATAAHSDPRAAAPRHVHPGASTKAAAEPATTDAAAATETTTSAAAPLGFRNVRD
jgi:hypothetical protein